MKPKTNPQRHLQAERKKPEQAIEVSEVMNAQRLLFDMHHMVHRTQLTLSNQLSEAYQAKVYLKR
jgi:threonine dehydratase